jgi:carboxypeptidase D
MLSANFHEGAKIISYPYDGDGNLIPGISGTENNTVDNDIYKILAKKYSQNMFPKLTYLNSVPSKDFGIINGADWYTLYGGMQDWEYLQKIQIHNI